jgi:hypothetical protein
MSGRTTIGERDLEVRLERMVEAIEPLPDEQLVEMARAASASTRSAPARSPRRPLRVVLAAAVALGVAALLPAVFGGDVRGLFTREASAQPPVGVWRWAGQLAPGRPVQADARVRLAVQRLGVVPARVHRVSRLGGATLLAAAGKSGRVCFAARTGTSFGGFTCVSLLSPEAMVLFSLAGGTVVLGVARTDVERVVATRADGSERELAPNSSRAFAGAAPGGFAYVSGYRGDGTLVARLSVGASLRSRLCGTAPAACTPAL